LFKLSIFAKQLIESGIAQLGKKQRLRKLLTHKLSSGSHFLYIIEIFITHQHLIHKIQIYYGLARQT
jgi:hypothetical protein